MNRVDYIFLVGGFAESKLLQDRVRGAFERDGLRVVVPNRPGLAVLRGAAMLGMGAASSFASRIARYTYGVRTSTAYDPLKEDHRGRATVSKKQQGVERLYIPDGFTAIVRKGTRISVEQTHRTGPLRCFDDQTEVSCRLFTTSAADASWTTEDGMVCLGEVRLPVAPGDTLHVELGFGRTEIRAVAVNERTGARAPAVVDYDFRTT